MSPIDMKRHAGATDLASSVRRWSAGALLALLGASACAGTTDSFTFGRRPTRVRNSARTRSTCPTA